MNHKWMGCVDLLREPQHWNVFQNGGNLKNVYEAVT